jgi:hypothetical protein
VPPPQDIEREAGGNFNSTVRAQAICLDVLAEVDPDNPMVPGLVQALAAAAGDDRRWRTTQENAFALLALGKTMRQQEGGSFTGKVTVGGKEVGSFDNRGAEFSNADWGDAKVMIEVSGNGTCYYYWRADGLPTGRQIDEYDRDLIVRRRYLDEEGRPIDYSHFRQGDLVVAEVTVQTTAGDLDNVAIVDLLPAGLEIENPRLQSRRALSWVEERAGNPLYMDFRDDRIVFYGNFDQGESYQYYYSLRAVTAGDFVLPPIRAEAMYAPMKSSVASSGRIIVRQPK